MPLPARPLAPESCLTRLALEVRASIITTVALHAGALNMMTIRRLSIARVTSTCSNQSRWAMVRRVPTSRTWFATTANRALPGSLSRSRTRRSQKRSRYCCRTVGNGGKPPEDAPGLRRSDHRRGARKISSTKAVGGFDLTFSPTKSVSTAWALADRETREVIYRCHQLAIATVLAYAEREVFHTRTGSQAASKRTLLASSPRASPTSILETAIPNCTTTWSFSTAPRLKVAVRGALLTVASCLRQR